MEVTALTLNCWGIAGISKDRRPRIEAIAQELSTGKYDFVFLQELWVEDDYQFIATKVSKVLPHTHYFHSGVIGSGVCILSKSVIVDVLFYPWALNGYIHKVQHGDWFGGKGVGLCTILHRNLKINLYVTHLHAEYNIINDEYRAHRVVQAFETSQLIRLTRGSADLCILGGDLNTQVEDLPCRLIRFNTPLHDSFLSTGKSEKEAGTSETPRNSYSAQSSLKSCPEGKRIDYIMTSSKQNLKIEIIDCFDPLPARVEGQTFGYSDHEAVCTKLRITETDNFQTTKNDEECVQALKDAINVCDTALVTLGRNQLFFLFLSGFVLALLLCLPRFSMFTDTILLLTHLILILFGAFCLIMGLIWNRMERHGIISGKLGMKIRLKSFSL